jgi:hypothetical protein
MLLLPHFAWDVWDELNEVCLNNMLLLELQCTLNLLLILDFCQGQCQMALALDTLSLTQRVRAVHHHTYARRFVTTSLLYHSDDGLTIKHTYVY